MAKTTLTQATQSAQILLMLHSSFHYTKQAVRLLSVVRSGIDDAVATLVATERSTTRLENAENDAERYLEVVDLQLRRLLGLFHVPDLVKGKLPTSNSSKKGTRADVISTLEKLEAIQPKLKALTIYKMMTNDNITAVEARGNAISTFSSVVRNTSWMDLLIYVGLTPTETHAYNTVSLAARFSDNYSSGMGVAKLDENISLLLGASYVPNSAPQIVPTGIVVVADNEFVLTVALTSNIVSSNKDVKKLFTELSKDASNSNGIALLFQEATTPAVLEIDSTLEHVRKAAQQKLDTLIHGLQTQVEVHAKLKTEKLAALKKKETDAAVKALKGLGVHLKTLAKHPELLAQALEDSKRN